MPSNHSTAVLTCSIHGISVGAILTVVAELQDGILVVAGKQVSNPILHYIPNTHFKRVLSIPSNPISKLRILPLYKDSKIPSRMHLGDAGIDLYAHSVVHDRLTRTTVIGTGVALEIPTGFVGYLHTRSSAFKRGIYTPLGVGVIDSGYRGEIKLVLSSFVASPSYYEIGDRVCQLVIVPVLLPTLVVTDKLTDTTRGDGGFGSTGS